VTDEVTTALIAGASGVAGGAVVAVSNYVLNRAQARDARRETIRRSMKQFLAVVNRVDHLLRLEPRSLERQPRSTWFWDRFPSLDYGLGRMNTRLLNPDLDVLTVKLNETLADALVTLPGELLAPMDAVAELMANLQRDADWWERWDTARGELVLAFRAAAGHSSRMR
jgi:hypothetical protein